MYNNILIPVINILQSEGKSEDEVAAIISEIITTSSALLYTKMLGALSDENLQLIEDCAKEEEANKLMARLYAEKTGTTPEELMNVFLKEYAATFIREHNKLKDTDSDIDK